MQQQRPRGPLPPPQQGPSALKILWNRTLRRLSSLQLAIGELALIALLSAVGTVIEQNKSLEYYMQVTTASPASLAAKCNCKTCIFGRGWLHPDLCSMQEG